MSEPAKETSNTPADHEPLLKETGLSRRRFLGGVGGMAAVMATGTAGLEPLINPASQAAAAEVGPLLGEARLKRAYDLRVELAGKMLSDGIPAKHPCNKDEELYPTRIGSYSKGLPHNDIGEVEPSAYNIFLEALTSGQPAKFELIPLGGARRLTSPQSGLAYDTEGNDPHQFKFPIAPALASAEEAAEAVELYWMALLRDTHFTDYYADPLVTQACQELTSLTAFKGPRINGQVTPQTLFRDNVAGALNGPYISQFMLKGTPFGAEYIERKMRTLLSGIDHMTDFQEWLAVQRGNVIGTEHFDSTRRYIRDGRDLGQWVHVDVLFQAYFSACLILGTPPHPDPNVGGIGAPLNPGNPYLSYFRQDPFATWGPPFIKALLCEVATRALKAVWFQKWFVHRRLRPEAFGGRIHVLKNGWNNTPYPIHASVLNSQALALTAESNGTYLLPMTFPEGSPTHPAYGAGHATVAGACVTILKALFDETFPVPDPVVPSSDGLALVPYSSSDILLTVGGELNKLASNVATGRNMAGVHWRTDGINSLLLGEQVAIKILRDHKVLLNEPGKFIFKGFLGNPIEI